LYLTGPAVGGTAGGPVAGQWYLRHPTGEVQSAIDVETAWNYTTGNSGMVVAVIDTGVRFDHPDLLRVAAGGNLLPGYDMISDVDTANDGDGRDADASDPGDWVTLDDVRKVGGPFEDCSDAAENSSWHGTQISGLIGALTNNGRGMAGVGPNIRVLPVRTLGKCGGFDSDIIAGMRWAAGLPVAGVPVNPTPARVLNLSLGGDGACEAAYRDALAEITARGAAIVAAAGNSAGHAVSAPRTALASSPWADCGTSGPKSVFPISGRKSR
jgi:serine protease